MDLEEEWRDIPPLFGYQVSSLGQVRSVTRKRSFLTRWGSTVDRIHWGRNLQLHKGTDGYLYFDVDGGLRWRVHRALCWAFNGDPPSDVHHAAHLDGDCLNNIPENLVWATAAENERHKVMHGTVAKGSRHGMSRESRAARILRDGAVYG